MEFKGKDELKELLLLYDNLVGEIDSGQSDMNDETAQRLYNIYDAITDLLKENQ